MMRTLDELAARGAARSPDRPAIVTPGGGALSYAALDRAASRFAALLAARGARSGDRLVLGNGNTPEFFVALFGAARAGLVVVPLDPGLAAAELRNLLDHARPHAVVVDARSAPVFAPLGAAVIDGAGLTSAASESVPAPPASPALPGAVVSNAPALVLYTSGTTGTPRGAMHGHAGILGKLEAICRWFRFDDTDRTLCLLPTHFGHGLVSSCLPVFHYGGSLVLCRPFDLELLPRVFALADDHAVTTFSSVPTIIRLVLRNAAIAPPRTGRLRFVTCASSPLHPEEGEAFERRFGVPLLDCYGLTEAGTWSAMSPLRPPRGGPGGSSAGPSPVPARDRRSVGVASDCRFRAARRDGAGWTELPAGEIGELQVSGPSVMLGYDGDPAATAAVLRDGWLTTGDLGSVDAQGHVFLSGRSKDLIIRAGANIYPAEVERVLLRHAGVAEAYVVGVEHTLLGEAVAACVVCGADGASVTERALIDHCREFLAAYKCPESIRFVDAVPKTSRGKVSRAALRALLVAT